MDARWRPWQAVPREGVSPMPSRLLALTSCSLALQLAAIPPSIRAAPVAADNGARGIAVRANAARTGDARQGYKFPGEKRALLIGVDRYEDPECPALRLCANDVQAVGNLLIDRGGYAKDRVSLLTDKAGGQPRLPTRANIERSLQTWLEDGREQDTLLFFFSGHGVRGEDGRDYLLPRDARRSALARTAVAMDDVLEKLRATGALQIVVITDACRELTEVGHKAEENAAGFGAASARIAVTHKLIQMRSCTEQETSLEPPGLENGLYTHSLLEALRGSADAYGDDGRADACVTVSEVHDYVYDHVTAWGRERGLSPRRWQHPQITRTEGGRGRIVLAGVPASQQRPVPGKAVEEYRRGQALNDFSDAESECYRKALTLCPTYAAAHHALGVVLAHRGDREGAAACFRRAIRADPSLAEPYVWLGYYALTGDSPSAEEGVLYCTRALYLAPRHPLAHYNLGVAFRLQDPTHESPEALARAALEWQQTIELRPRHGEAWYNLGRACLDLDRDEEALQACTKAADLLSQDPAAHTNHGVALERFRRWADAEQAYLQALRLDRKFVDALQSLGALYHRVRKYADAERMYRRAIEVAKLGYKPHVGLASVLVDKGELDKAKAAFRQMWDQAPSAHEPEAEGEVDAVARKIMAAEREKEAEDFRREVEAKTGRKL